MAGDYSAISLCSFGAGTGVPGAADAAKHGSNRKRTCSRRPGSRDQDIAIDAFAIVNVILGR